MRYLRHVIRLCLLVLATLWIFAGCSEDNDNPAGDNGTDTGHLEAFGVMIVSGEDTLVTAPTGNDADVTGEIHMYEGEQTETLIVYFKDDEGQWFLPESGDADHSLTIVIGNGDMIEATIPANDWTFTLTGLEEGETWIRVKVIHGDHDDYVSPHLPVHVEHSEGYHGPPVGMNLIMDGIVVVTANASGIVTGDFHVNEEDTTSLIETWLFDEDSVVFQPDDDHFLEINVADTTIMDVAIADEVPGNENIWIFTIAGLQQDETSMILRIGHCDHYHYTSPSVTIYVEP